MPTRVVPDVMLDLETWGRSAGCAIMSAGMVRFDPVEGKLLDEAEVFFSQASQLEFGLGVDPETVLWHREQPKAAQRAMKRSLLPTRSRHLVVGLTQISKFLKASGPRPRLWSCGADFDLPILSAAYRAAFMELPWEFRDSRCFRTYKNLFQDLEAPAREGTHHDALDDARHQARHALLVAQRLKDK